MDFGNLKQGGRAVPLMQLHLKAPGGNCRILCGEFTRPLHGVGLKQENAPHVSAADKRPGKNQLTGLRKAPDVRHVPALQCRGLLSRHLLIGPCLEKSHHIKPHPVGIGPKFFGKGRIKPPRNLS